QTLFYVLLVASIVMLIPAIIAASVLSRFILNPIRQLIDTMRINQQEVEWEKIELKNRSKDELYEMGETFNEMMETLERTYQKQEMFVSDASHELKTPIAIIKSYAQLMERHGKDPKIMEEAVDAIDSESDRMQQLVEQMLLLAKSGETITFAPIALGDIAEASILRFREMTDKEIIWQKARVTGKVLGDKDQLTQVVYILLDNAIKYGGDTITVRLED